MPFSPVSGSPDCLSRCNIDVIPEIHLAIEEYLIAQGRFDQMAAEMIENAQPEVDYRWKEILVKTGMGELF